MRKILFFTSLALGFALFSGCSGNDKKDANQTKQTSNIATATTSSIEVSQNENANEIKVAPKAKDGENRAYYIDYGNEKNAQIENKKPRTALDANINVRSPYEKVQLSMLVKGLSKDFILKCSACHDDYANGVIGPSLLGKSSQYIYDKIQKFKSDKTVNVLMSELVMGMSDKEIKDMADEVFNFNEEIKKLKEKQ